MEEESVRMDPGAVRRRGLQPLGAAAFALLLAACGGEAKEQGPAFGVRDSAGVRIAQSARPAWAEGQGWTVGETPRLEIPTGRHADALVQRLPDGRVLVASGWPHALQVYDAAATRADTLPLPEGVNEVGWMGPGAGDSLMAWHPTYRRLMVFSPEGRLGRTTRVEGLQYVDPLVLGRLADGTLLATEGHQQHVDAASPRRGLVRHVLVGADGTQRGVFAELPDAGRMRGMEVPFSPRAVVAVRGTEVLVGDNQAFEFSVYGPDGTLRGVVRRAWTPLPVTPEDVESWHARREPSLSDASGAVRALVEKQRQERRAVPAPAAFPAYARLLADPAGNVWAEEARASADYYPRWSVFSAEGRWLGTVRMPSGFDLRQAGPDWVLGVEPNASGRTLVRLYPLAKPASASTSAPADTGAAR